MNSSKVVKDLMSLKETYRKQNFSYTTEQQAQYKELLAIRREQVKQWHKDNPGYAEKARNKKVYGLDVGTAGKYGVDY